jgi:hypothetical protein
MLIIFSVPYLIWRLGNTDYWAPLVVVQIITGILLGPGILGRAYPEYYGFVFNPQVVQSLNGIAWWAVMIFVMIAGIELDLKKAWEHRRESTITAGLALGMPLAFGCVAALGMLGQAGWVGANARDWQFVLGVGMACAVTALPILILLMEKLEILRQPIGQRILRYASLDDIAIWGVMAVILLDWDRVGRQAGFLLVFALATKLFRASDQARTIEVKPLPETDKPASFAGVSAPRSAVAGDRGGSLDSDMRAPRSVPILCRAARAAKRGADSGTYLSMYFRDMAALDVFMKNLPTEGR